VAGEANAPRGLQAEGAVYRPHERTSRLRFRGPAPWKTSLAILALSAVLPFLAFGYPVDHSPMAGLPAGAEGSYLSGLLLFLVPGFVGGLLTTPLARSLGGRFPVRRSLFLGAAGLGIVGAMLALWRLLSLLVGGFSVEDPLILGFGLSLWLREITMIALSNRAHARSLPAGLSFPVVGLLLVGFWLGTDLVLVIESLVILAFAFLAAEALLRATDRPLLREFGEGSVVLLRPLMEHMSDRDPAASARMERFFEGISTRGDLDVGVLCFRSADRVKLALVAASVHPGPFAELGSSDFPKKVGRALREGGAEEAMVPHAPSTHAQDIPTSSEVSRVVAAARELVGSSRPGAVRASPLVSPRQGSTARAQVLGDCVLVLLSQAPEPTDDIDYALGEMIREEGRRLGFRHVLVLDGHNSFAENRGDVPFGSPEGFRLLADAKAAMGAALAAAKPGGTVRLGVCHRTGFTPDRDGMGGEGLLVAVLEAAGSRTALALFDANNLRQGLREPLRTILEQEAGGPGEVCTTDNHVVHEVQGGSNTLGDRRGRKALEDDIRDATREAVGRLAPVEVASGETTVRGVRILGPGVVTRLMTALADSFALFWLFFLASFSLAALAGALLLAFLR
jgi:predicted neutral ceramidase superfamily lipid hydrolase